MKAMLNLMKKSDKGQLITRYNGFLLTL